MCAGVGKAAFHRYATENARSGIAVDPEENREASVRQRPLNAAAEKSEYRHRKRFVT